MKKMKKIFTTVLALCMAVCSVNFTNREVNAVEYDNDNTVIINDTEFSYHGDAGEFGGWGVDQKQPTLYNGDSHWSNLSGTPKEDSVYFEFTFTGDKVALYGNKEAKFGMVKVYIDGVEKGTYDGYSPTKIYQQKLWESEKLSNDTHTLKAVLTSEKNPQSQGYNTLIDFAKVSTVVETLHEYTLEIGQSFTLPMTASLDAYEWESTNTNVASVKDGVVSAIAEGETTVRATNKQSHQTDEITVTVIPALKDTDTGDSYYSEVAVNDSVRGTGELQFNYHGNWGTDNGVDGLYKGDAHWSDVSSWGGNPRNHFYTFKFTGRKIDIYGSLQPKLGIYDVYIDNVFMGKIDAYGNPQQKNQLYFSSPVLEEKQHELKVVMTGEKNPSSKAPSGFVDYVKVTKNMQRIYPSEVNLDKNNTTWEKDMPIVPEVTYLPETTNQRSVTFEVDEEMIRVNEDGSLTPLKAGETSIVAVAKGKGDTVVKSEPFKINIIGGSDLGKLDFTSKNRRVEAELYDQYAKVINKEAAMTLWQNDAGNNAAVLLTKGEDVTAKITVSDFTNELGDVLNGENVEVNFQKYISTYEGSNWIPTNPRPFDPPKAPEGHRVQAADVIYGPELEVPAYTAQPIWIKVNTPEGTKPGTYEGTITVTLNGTDEIELKQTVEVLELSLDEENDYYLNLWQYPYSSSEYYGVEPFSEEHLAIVKNQMQPYLEAGGKTGTASIVEEPWYHQTYCDYPSMVKWSKDNGVWSFDYTDFDKWVDFLINEIGVSYVECYSIVPWQNRIQFTENGEVKVQTAAPGSKEWTDAWGHFLRDFTKHLDEKGWYDEIIIAMDERPMDQMSAALDLIESIPNKDGHTFKVGGAVGSYNKDVWDRLFTVTPHIGNIEWNIPLETMRQVAEERRAEGKLTTIYTMIGDYPGMFSLSDPAEAAWTIWYAEYCNTDGFLRWAYDAWVQNPLEDNAHPYFEAGDMFFVYPGDYKGADTTPRTSPRFEMMEEAIRDVRKLHQLRETSDEMKEKVTALVDSVKNFKYQSTNNGVGTAGFNEGTPTAKVNLSNEVDRLHAETLALAREYESSIVKSADYSEVDKQIEATKEINRELYTEDSLKALDHAIDAVVYDLSSAHQERVDAMASSIETARKELVLKDADYTKVDAAIKEAEKLNPEDYENYADVKNAIDEVVRDLDITKQADVDKMATNILDAINGLIVKPEVKPNPENPDPEVKPEVKPTPDDKPSTEVKPETDDNTPPTGDTTNYGLLFSSILVAGGFMIILFKKRKALK